MKKRKVREPRREWAIKPFSRIKESDKLYSRDKEKSKLRREENE